MNRFKASFVHFLISALVVATAMLVVLLVWYPPPYSESNGVFTIVKILIGVDLILGPLLTFVVFNNKKPKAELSRDLGLIGAVQIAALVYGLHTLFAERPVFVAFAVDRLEVVTASEVDVDTLSGTVQNRSFVGPTPVFALPGQTNEESEKLLFDVFEGKPDIDRLPERYRPLTQHVDTLKKKSLRVDAIIEAAHAQGQAREAHELRTYSNANPSHFYVPLRGKIQSMVMAVDDTGHLEDAFAIIPWSINAGDKNQSKVVEQAVIDVNSDATLD